MSKTKYPKRITKVYEAKDIPDLSDDGILNFLSYQPKSDYRKPLKIEKLSHIYAVRITLEEVEL